MRSASSPRAVSITIGRAERGGVALEQPLGLVAAGRLERLVAVALEGAHDDIAHDRLVIDHKHGGHGLIVPPRGCRDLKSVIRWTQHWRSARPADVVGAPVGRCAERCDICSAASPRTLPGLDPAGWV